MFIHETCFLFRYSENIHDSQVLPRQSYIPIGGVDGSGVVYIRPLPKGISDPLREKNLNLFLNDFTLDTNCDDPIIPTGTCYS